MAAPTIPQILAPLAGEVISGTYLVQWSESIIPDAVAPSFIASGAQVFAPTLEAGVPPGTVAPSFIPSAAQVFAPTVVAGSAGGATVYGQDTFTDTNGVLIQNHTSDSGHSWVRVGTVNADIQSNRFVGGYGSGAAYYLNVTPASADYEVSVDVTKLSNTFTGWELRARWDGASNYYYVEWNESVTQWRLRRSNPFGVPTGTVDYTDSGFTTSATRTIVLRVQGSSIKVFIDGVERLSGTDSNYTAAGVAGLRSLASNAAGINTDNFVVRSIA